jgi:hypothetical protein
MNSNETDSREDLLFEIKRLTQRYDCVLSDYQMIVKENELLKLNPSSNNSLTHSDLWLQMNEKLLKELNYYKKYFRLYSQKFHLIQTSFSLEKNLLTEIKNEFHLNLTQLMASYQTIFQNLVKNIQSREYGLLKRLQNMTCDLISEKDKNETMKQANMKSEVRIKELEENLCHEKEEMLIRMNQQRLTCEVRVKELEEELSREKEEMTSQLNQLTQKLERYQEDHRREVIELHSNISQIELDYQASLQEKDVLLSALTKEKNELRTQSSQTQSKYETVSRQFHQLCETNANLQKDFKSVLMRYENLQKENKKLSSKTSFEEKLQSVTRKLLEMEELSRNEAIEVERRRSEEEERFKGVMAEMEKLKLSCDEAQERNRTLVGELRKAQEIAQEKEEKLLEEERRVAEEEKKREQKRVKEREEERERSGKEIRELSEAMARLQRRSEEEISAERALKREEIEKMEREMKRLQSESEKRSQSLLERSERALREEREVCQKLKQELEEVKSEMIELRVHSKSVEEMRELQQVISTKSSKIEELSLEIERLKDTIRRECEERTEMLIEMSELRDQIKRLSSMQLQLQNRSKTSSPASPSPASVSASAVSSSSSAQSHSQSQSQRGGVMRSTSIGVGKESGGTVGDPQTHRERQRNEEASRPPLPASAEDLNWAKLRQQGSSGGSSGSKGKRNSKYR